MSKFNKSDIVRQELVLQSETIATKTLARVLNKKYPNAFPTVEHARQIVRQVRGAHGTSYRNRIKDPELTKFYRDKEEAGSLSHELPKPQTSFKDWEPFQLEGPRRILILSDIHIPFFWPDALNSAINYGKKKEVDTVLLNGDFGDFYAISRWETNPERRKFKGELADIQQFLRYLRQKFSKCDIIAKQGNHEERWERYMWVNAPHLLGISDFDYDNLLRLPHLGITSIKHKRPIRLGLLNVIHGHEYKFAISNPVNPARGLFLRCLAHTLCGHFHQSSYHSEKTVQQERIATWSTGCLCEMHPEYMPYNKWSHGFAVVEVDKNNKFQVENKVIASDGRVY